MKVTREIPSSITTTNGFRYVPTGEFRVPMKSEPWLSSENGIKRYYIHAQKWIYKEVSWEPEIGEEYFFIDNEMRLNKSVYKGGVLAGNCFRTVLSAHKVISAFKDILEKAIK